jgi:hypothetical protein
MLWVKSHESAWPMALNPTEALKQLAERYDSVFVDLPATSTLSSTTKHD